MTSLGPLSPHSTETIAEAPLLSPVSTTFCSDTNASKIDDSSCNSLGDAVRMNSTTIDNPLDNSSRDPPKAFNYDMAHIKKCTSEADQERTNAKEKHDPRHSITFPTGNVFLPDFSGPIMVPGMHPSCNAYRRSFSNPFQTNFFIGDATNNSHNDKNAEVKRCSLPLDKLSECVQIDSPSGSSSSSKSTPLEDNKSLPNLKESRPFV